MRLDMDPNAMTPDERARELQEIFARGIVRALLISGTRGPHSGEQALTGSALQSDECAPRHVGVNQSISGGMA